MISERETSGASAPTSEDTRRSTRLPSWLGWLGLMFLVLIPIVIVDFVIAEPNVSLDFGIAKLGLIFEWELLVERVRVFPHDVGRDIGLWIDEQIIDWLNVNLGFFFNAVKTSVAYIFEPLEAFLKWLPWPVVVFGLGLVSWKLVGRTIAIFSVVAMILLGFFGLWESTMETAALMIVTVTSCIAIAVPIGIWASQSDRLDAILRPILDGMQTMPSFVYLVPAIAFFSLGNTPAVIATLVYAVPPAVRLTNLGIRQVSRETIEATESFGATPWQLMLKVKIPLAMPTIMAGVNQTTLMALAMVVIASLVGASGLGEDVLRGLGRLESGNAFLAGLGIVFLAVIIDRNTQAFAKKQQETLGVGLASRIVRCKSGFE